MHLVLAAAVLAKVKRRDEKKEDGLADTLLSWCKHAKGYAPEASMLCGTICGCHRSVDLMTTSWVVVVQA